MNSPNLLFDKLVNLQKDKSMVDKTNYLSIDKLFVEQLISLTCSTEKLSLFNY